MLLHVNAVHNLTMRFFRFFVVWAVIWLPGRVNGRAVAAEPATARYFVIEGVERARRGDHRAAIEQYNQALRTDTSIIEAYAYRGFSRIAIGDTSGGEADLQRAVRLRIEEWTALLATKPDDSDTLLRRGVAYSDIGEYRMAIGDFEHVLRLEPGNAQSYYLRGNAHYRLGNQADALADYNTALRLNADLLPAYVARAAANLALGNRAAATADYESARRLTRDDQVH